MEFPWYNTAKVDYKVEIVVSRFDSDQSGEATLNAKWTIRAGHDGHVLLTAVVSSDASTPAGTSTSAEVAALSANTGAFAQQIASAIMQLHGHAASARD